MAIPEERKEEHYKTTKLCTRPIKWGKKMVEDERQCVDILTQISACYEGMRKAGQLMMRNYVENCEPYV